MSLFLYHNSLYLYTGIPEIIVLQDSSFIVSEYVEYWTSRQLTGSNHRAKWIIRHGCTDKTMSGSHRLQMAFSTKKAPGPSLHLQTGRTTVSEPRRAQTRITYLETHHFSISAFHVSTHCWDTQANEWMAALDMHITKLPFSLSRPLSGWVSRRVTSEASFAIKSITNWLQACVQQAAFQERSSRPA